MGKRTKYTPGTFNWIDLVCADSQEAKAFYGRVFGWTYKDRPNDIGNVYTMALMDGEIVAGMYQKGPNATEVPAHWSSYVAVDDAQAVINKVAGLGGEVMAEPFEAMDYGRMGIIRDPSGAHLGLWEPMEHHGASLVNAHGALCWNELNTREADAARNFFGGLFGWEFQEDPKPPYINIVNGGRANGAILNMRGRVPDSVPAFWNVYFAVDHCDSAADRAKEAGGSVHVGPLDIDFGRFAVVADPEGAVFSIIQLNQADE